MQTLPYGEFEGQRFIDASYVEWIFDYDTQCWKRKGKIDATPIADGQVTGLLAPDLKYMLDKVQNKGGGFAIITKPHLQFRSNSNPDGVIFGDVDLISDSLDIKCVHADGKEIANTCLTVSFTETDTQPPGFDINLSDNLLNTLCVEVPGGPGQPGPRGDTGPDGADGTGDGPRGLKGLSGKNATEGYTFSGVRIVDLDTTTDVAVTKMELEPDSGKLFITKGHIKVPDNEEAAADKLTVQQINRGVRFLGNCFDYELTMLPCMPDEDYEELNPAIAYYPSHFDIAKEGRAYQLKKKRLSDLVDDMIDYYQTRLDKIADQYDKEIEELIKKTDKDARQVLDTLGDRLAECENITYLEYCIGIGEPCIPGEGTTGTGSTSIIDLPASSPECQVIAEAVGGKDSTCKVLTTMEIPGNYAPVLSFEAPDDFKLGSSWASMNDPAEYERTCPEGCWTIKGNGAIQFVKRGGVVPAGWTPIGPPNNPTNLPVVETRRLVRGIPIEGEGPASEDDQAVEDLTQRLRSAKTLYKKHQIQYSDVTAEFPAGNYAFVYVGGGFKQDRLSKGQAHGEDTEDLVQGAFQDYWVGNEGNGGSNGPFYVQNTFNLDLRLPIETALSTTETGLEIGFAPANRYERLLPDDYFEEHAYDPTYEVGNNNVELPNTRNDFDGLSADVIADENKITWHKFPTLNETNRDLSNMQNKYLQGPVNRRMINIKTTTPGFFFARVKTAFSAYNFYGTLIMPPVVRMKLRPASESKANIRLLNPKAPAPQITNVVGGPATAIAGPLISAFNNAVPIASGSVSIQVVKVDPPTTEPVAANITTQLGKAYSPTTVPNSPVDSSLDDVVANGDILHICKSAPVDYSSIFDISLGSGTPVITGPTKTPSGESITVSTTGPVTETGSATHFAILGSVAKRILYSGALSSPLQVTAGNTFTMPEFVISSFY
jgi:hypothetical protein